MHAFISGISGGIGEQLALSFLSQGYSITGLKRRQTAHPRSLFHSQVKWIEYDYFDEKTLQNISDELRDTPVNLLINSIGVFIADEIEIKPDNLNLHMDVNFFVPALLTQTLIPNLKLARGARIINISSASGVRIKNNNLSYNASKHALEALTKTLNLKYADEGIWATSIQPSIVGTKMADHHIKLGKKALPISNVVSAVKFICSLSPDAHVSELKITLGPE